MDRCDAPNLAKQSDRDDAVAVVRRLREAGHVAYFAGGCVRDTLLGLSPKDYDVATDAPPKRVRELFANTQAVGAAFGVILVRQRKSVIEVATFRTDGKYLDGRRPEEVTFTTAEEDAKRRDFTINGLFLDPLDGDKVIDFVGGQVDLQSKTLRAIGEPAHRFEEDHLRLLRAVRFAARFELEIEPVTARAISTHALHLQRISPERIADELRRMLAVPEQGSDWAWLALYDSFPGLAECIFRFLAPAPTAAARERHARIFTGFRANDPWPFGLCLATMSLDWLLAGSQEHSIEPLLTHESALRIVRAARQALRISNDEAEMVLGSIEGVGMISTQDKITVARGKRFLARPTSDLSRKLLNAAACHIGSERVQRLNAELDELAKQDVAPPPFLSGDDLTAAGWKPGPLFKRVLDLVYDAQLEGRIADKAHAITMAERLHDS